MCTIPRCVATCTAHDDAIQAVTLYVQCSSKAEMILMDCLAPALQTGPRQHHDQLHCITAAVAWSNLTCSLNSSMALDTASSACWQRKQREDMRCGLQ